MLRASGPAQGGQALLRSRRVLCIEEKWKELLQKRREKCIKPSAFVASGPFRERTSSFFRKDCLVGCNSQVVRRPELYKQILLQLLGAIFNLRHHMLADSAPVEKQRVKRQSNW